MNIVARKRGDKYVYYSARKEDGIKHEHYLTQKELEIAKQYIIRKFNQARLKDAVEEKTKIDRLLEVLQRESFLSRYMSSHPGHIQLINEWIKKQGIENLRKEDREIFEAVENWKKLPYEQNQRYPEQLKVNTIVPGLKVRSKSESMMVLRFEERHVAYHYEEAFHGVDDNGYSVVIYPDFNCKNMYSNELVIVEHLGMCDNEEYMNGFYWKMRIYQRAGFFLGKNLIVTTETKDSPLDINVVDFIIDNWLT